MSEETNVVAIGAGSSLANLINNPEAAAKAVATARENNAVVASQAGSGGAGILKMDQSGAWSLNRQPVPAGTMLAIDPRSLSRGFICWKGGKPVEEIMVGMLDGQPPVIDENKHGPFKGAMEGWKESIGFNVQIVGQAVEGRFTADSMGAKRMFKELMDAVLDQIEMGEGLVIPIIQLSSESYENKSYSKTIFNPIASIVGWSDVEGNIHNVDGTVEGALA